MAIKINFLTQFDNRGLKKAQRELGAIGQNLSRALDVAVIGGLAAATTGLVSAIKSASNFAAEYEGVSQVFGKAAESVQAFAKEASRTAGLSQTEALQASKVFGLFATKAGLSAESAAGFSTTLVQLAGDLGSFNDVPTEEALAAIQSGLQGQAEPLRKFGVFLDDASLRAEALAMEIYDGTGALSAQQKMMASYSLILKQTNVQQGDYLKYADTFGNATKTITKDLANLQIEIGEAVLPALESLLPAVRELVPVLGAQLKAAIDSVDWKAFFKVLVDGISFLITYGPQLATLATAMFAVSKAIMAAEVAMKLMSVASALMTAKIGAASTGFGIFNAVLNANPIVRVISLLGLLAIALAGVGIASQTTSSRIPSAVMSRAMKAGQEAADAAAKQFKAGSKQQGIAVANARKQAYDQVLKNYQFGLDALKASAEATPAIPEPSVPDFSGGTGAGTKGLSAAKKVVDQTKDLAKEAQEAIQEFKDSFTDLLDFTTLTTISRDVGEFEQSVSSSFERLYDNISRAPEGTIGLAPLRNFLDAQKALLIENARQRDEIVKKRSLAQALIDDVKGSLMGTGNLASLLETQTRQVTTSITRIVDGFTVTTRQTVDEVVGGQGVVSKLQAVVTKTRAFAKQLTSLKALGLDKDLFKQIVDAGPDVGGELAKEILDGGADSVKALNDTFAELESVTADVAEQTAVVMLNAGVEVAGGLVNGLLSQEQALINAAQTLAQSFIDAFNALMAKLTLPAIANFGGTNAAGFAYSTDPMMGGSAESQFGSGTPWAQTIANSRAAQVNNYYIDMKAGIVTGGKTFGQEVQAELNRYARASNR